MGVESNIKSTNLEQQFRKNIKQYRALLRWGIDKVFHDTRVDMLFADARKHIDNNEISKAETTLSELNTQINLLETQYPDQKNEIEKELYSRIHQLEVVIEKSSDIEPYSAHQYLQTLEISRVAIQNDDWAEAKNKINLVENEVLNSVISDDLNLSDSFVMTETTSAESETINASARVPVNDNIIADETAKEAPKEHEEKNTNKVISEKTATLEAAITSADNTPEKEDTQKTAEKVVLSTPKPEEEKNNSESNTQNIAKSETQETTTDSTLDPIAQALQTSAIKTMIGKLLNEKDLLKTLYALDQSNLDNLRIGFIASPDEINKQLSVFSKRPISLKDSGTQTLLLRFSISRTLSVYLMGIPANTSTDFSQLNTLIPELSACFINTNGLPKSCSKILAEKLQTSPTDKDKLFIQLSESLESNEKELFEDQKIKCTIIENNDSLFVKNAATHLGQYSIFS